MNNPVCSDQQKIITETKIILLDIICVCQKRRIKIFTFSLMFELVIGVKSTGLIFFKFDESVNKKSY